MKNTLKRSAAMLLALMLASVLCLTAFAENITYSDTRNSGRRDELCLTLEGTKAADYYSGSNTYESLSLLGDSALLSALRSLMTDTHVYKSSYADSKNYADKTDCQGGDGSIVLLYTSAVVGVSDFIGSGSIGWNREHVWPKSLGGFGNDGAGADLHHIRPDDVTTNANRGNLKYGNVASGSEVKGSVLVSGAVGGKSGNGYFEPLDNVKGDVARICLYVWARYGGELSKCSEITNVFESVDVLLDWCESDPVDTWEMGRNEVIYKVQGNRNVFIDYPEYAWLLFGEEVPKDMSTPSGMASKVEETTAQTTEAETAANTAEEITTEAPETTTAFETSAQTVQTEQTEQTEPAPAAGCGASIGIGILLILPIAFILVKKKEE